MLWKIILILLLCWALGFGFHVAGNFIHVLIVLAVVLLVVELLRGRGGPPAV